MKCNFCQREQDSPCRNTAEAAMSCGVNEEIALTTVPRQNSGPVLEDLYGNPITDSFEGFVTDAQPITPEPRMRRIRPDHPFGQPSIVTLPEPADIWNPVILLLLKEAAKLTLDEPEVVLQTIWDRAKAMADEYEVVLEPTIKKKK